MNRQANTLVGAALIVGAAIGGGAGYVLGQGQGMAVVIDRSLRKDAAGVQKLVTALRQLRRGESEAALGTLERHMEDQLVPFDPHEPYPGLSESTKAEVAAAIATVRDYRADHPRAAPRPAIDPMVDRLLQR